MSLLSSNLTDNAKVYRSPDNTKLGETQQPRMRMQKLYLIITTISMTAILFMIFLVTSIIQDQVQTTATANPEDPYQPGMKTILMWNTFFQSQHMAHNTGHRIFQDYHCPVDNCYIFDMSDGKPEVPVPDVDLVWFHAWDIPGGTLLRNKPEVRKPQQRYLFYLHESPATFRFDFAPLNGFFNWTATYRRDSDLYMPYGWLTNISSDQQQKSKPNKIPTKWLQPIYEDKDISKNTTKNKLAVWIVSNCVTIPSNRDIYVEELLKYIDIDIFGKCGEPCGEKCSDEMLEKNYKFYLAFENALCGDYVTEKFFRILQLNLVPIVFGGADYKKEAPPMSYIDIKDYETTKELVEYLLYLDENPSEYQKYFWWKKYYEVRMGTDHVVCQMCQMLNEPNTPPKVHYELEEWWNGPNVCYSQFAMGFSDWLGRAMKHPKQMIEHWFSFVIDIQLPILILIIIIITGLIVYVISISMKKIGVFITSRKVRSMGYSSINKIVYD